MSNPEYKYDLVVAGLEPQVTDLFEQCQDRKALMSIAISLKRIADCMTDGTLPTAISNAISGGIYDGLKS